MVNPKDVEAFMQNIEDATEDTALYYLEMCNGNLDEAMCLYFELNGTRESETTNVRREEPVASIPPTPTIPNDIQEDYVRAPDKHFSQALIHDMDESNFLYYNQNKKEKKIDLGNDSFGQLFSPPQEIICPLSFDEARKKAKQENKYLLVNIQNSEFDSMKLNRDIWKNETVQEIIKDFFIFWLRHEQDQDAVVFMHTYKVSTLPYICVLCKRTGRQLKIWNFKQFEDCVCAQSQLYEFIETMDSQNTQNQSKPSPIGSDLKQTSSNNSTSNISVTSENANKKGITATTTTIQNTVKATMKSTNNTTNNTEKDTKNTSASESKPKVATTALNTNIEEYNQINNELSELHKLRMKRMKK